MQQRDYHRFTLSEAWNRDAAHPTYPLSHANLKVNKFQMLVPTLTCADCCQQATFSDAGGVVDAGDKMSKQFDKLVGSDRNNAMEDEEESQGKEWIEMVEGIALFFNEALPVNLLFAEERGQYSLLRSQILTQRRNSVASTKKENGCGVAINQENRCANQSSAPHVANTLTASSKSSAVIPSSSDDKSPPQNRLPEHMSKIYGCEHLLRLFLRLPSVVVESLTRTEMESRRIFSRIGDLLQFLQKNQSPLFQSSFRKPLVRELCRVGCKRDIRAIGV